MAAGPVEPQCPPGNRLLGGIRPIADALGRIGACGGTRWAVEESFETAKGAGGLDQYEVRSWHGWYRHMTLALFAQAYLTVIRAAAVAENHAQKKCSGALVWTAS